MNNTRTKIICPLALLLSISAAAQVPSTTLTASDGHGADEFGYKVAARDSVLLVSAWKADATMGAAFVFSRNASMWTELRRLTSDDYGRTTNDYFGSDVAVNADYYFVGTYKRSRDRGSVFVFSRDHSRSQVPQLLEPSSIEGLFGWSLAVTDELLVVGTLAEDAAYVFKNQAGLWVESARLVPPQADIIIDFGRTVAVIDSTVIIGAPYFRENGIRTGAVFVYTQTTNGAVFEQLIIPDNPQDGSNFGIVLSASANGLAVAATRYQGTQPGRGAVFYYSRKENRYTHSQTIESPHANDSSFAFELSMTDSLLAVGSLPESIVYDLCLYSLGDNGWKYEATIPDATGDVLLESEHLFVGDIRFSGGSVLVYEHSAIVTAIGRVPEVPHLEDALPIHPFPNPANDGVTIALPQTMDHSFSIEVVNVLGRRVYSTRISNRERADNRVLIATSNWLPGAYFIRIMSEKRTYTGTVMIR